MNKLFFVPISLILAIGILLFLLLPKMNVANYLAKEVKQKEEELRQRQANLNSTLSALRELKYYQGALDKLATALPVEFFPASLLGYFQEQASKSGLVFEGISENQGQISSPVSARGEVAVEGASTAPVSSVSEYNFFCQTQGSIENFEAFLKLLEKSSRLIEVENFSFTASNPGAEEASEFNLQAKVYHY